MIFLFHYQLISCSQKLPKEVQNWLLVFSRGTFSEREKEEGGFNYVWEHKGRPTRCDAKTRNGITVRDVNGA